MVDLDDVISRLVAAKDKKPGTSVDLAEEEVTEICKQAREVFLSQPMLLKVSAPVRICGDLHGQYFDLLRIFDYGGFPPEANYLFLGDYIDRGKQSVECMVLLFAYKIKYPDKVHLLRGNHESERINRIYGFYDECKRRFSVKMWKEFCNVFNCMPCCGIISETIICMHGGLSPELDDLEKINAIERPTEIPEEGLMTDLVWADPDSELTVRICTIFFQFFYRHGSTTPAVLKCD